MVPIGIIVQALFMAYRLNGKWRDISFSKKVATMGMGGLASTLTGLYLIEFGLSTERMLFWMLIAAGTGGELVQLVTSNFLNQILKRLGGTKCF